MLSRGPSVALALLALTGCADGVDPRVSRPGLTSSGPPRSVAAAGLAELARGVPRDREAGYGFADGAALARASVGGPPLQELVARADGTLHATASWRFPVQVDGRTTSLLTVAWHEGRWQAVALGAARLAAELAAVDGGRRPALLRAPRLHSSFLVRRDVVGGWRCRPLTSARRGERWLTRGELRTLLRVGGAR